MIDIRLRFQPAVALMAALRVGEDGPTRGTLLVQHEVYGATHELVEHVLIPLGVDVRRAGVERAEVEFDRVRLGQAQGQAPPSKAANASFLWAWLGSCGSVRSWTIQAPQRARGNEKQHRE